MIRSPDSTQHRVLNSTWLDFQVAWQAELRADDTSKILLLDHAKDTLMEASWSGFALSCSEQSQDSQRLSLSLVVSRSAIHSECNVCEPAQFYAHWTWQAKISPSLSGAKCLCGGWHSVLQCLTCQTVPKSVRVFTPCRLELWHCTWVLGLPCTYHAWQHMPLP